jgi:hypothetical protein
MRTVVTSHTLPMVATIGGDGVGAQAKVEQVGDAYELTLSYEEGGVDEYPPTPDDETRARIAATVRGIDPAWLRSAVDAQLGSMADDPYLTAAAVLADWIEGTR